MPTLHEEVRRLPDMVELSGHERGEEPLAAAEEAFKLLEGRWKMNILFHLAGKERMRFSQIERALPQVTQKMLIQQLRDLEANGIVQRNVFHTVPPRVEYCLTDLGLALRPALSNLVEWATLLHRTPQTQPC